jgi:hypothetical protein
MVDSWYSDVGDAGPAGRAEKGVRTLPIRVDPLDDESLDSWLEAYARRTHATWGDMLAAVGMDRRRPADRGRTVHVALTAEQIVSTSYATGVAPHVLRSLTLDSLVPLADGGTLPQALQLPGSRFCPLCLGERVGRWRLWWRLRWAFACPTHSCLLLDACPTCQRLQRIEPLPKDLVPNPALCTRRNSSAGGRNPQRCPTRLADTAVLDLGADHPALTHQHTILNVLRIGTAAAGIYSDSPAPAVQFLRDLTAVGHRALRYATHSDLRDRIPDDLGSGLPWVELGRTHSAHSLPPRAMTRDSTAVIAAAAACVAMPVLSCVDAKEAAEQLHWLISAMRRRGVAVSASNIGWGREVSQPLVGAQLAAVGPFLGPVDQLRYRCSAPSPRRASTPFDVSHSVPALLWPRWALQLTCPGVGFDQLRSVLSVVLLIAGSRTPLDDTCSRLGAITDDRAVSRVLQALCGRPDWSTRAAALVELADQLRVQPGPIDYRRRRELCSGDLMPDAQWREICRDTATPIGRAVKAHLYRCWLYQRLTGSPGRLSSHAIPGSAFASALADLPRSLSPELMHALDAAGEEWLMTHGTVDEPLFWHPTVAACLMMTPSPSVDDGDGRLSTLHRFIAIDGLSLGAAATELGISIDAAREALNQYPAPRHLSPTTLRAVGGSTARAREALSRERFVELYLERGLGLAAIGAMVGVSRQTVTRLARDYGVAVRTSPVRGPETTPP